MSSVITSVYWCDLSSSTKGAGIAVAPEIFLGSHRRRRLHAETDEHYSIFYVHNSYMYYRAQDDTVIVMI